MLTWGLTWGASHAAAQGFPAVAPNGYPPPGYGTPYGPPPGFGTPYGPPPGYFGPPPGMPMQPMPMQGMPMQGMPMQGMPMQPMPMQGMPMQPMPMQGMPMQPMPMQPMPMQGMPMQPMPMQATPAFPGFAPYAGNPAGPSTPVPALPTGRATATDAGKAPAASEPAAQAAPTEKGEKIAAPKAPPVATETLAGEPMISFINGLPPGYLQSAPDGDDYGQGPGHCAPQRPNCDHCWFMLQYVMGFNKPGVLPAPLVTTSNNAVPPFGGLGSPSTAILFGDRLSYSMQSGIRTNFGMFLDNSGCWSIEGDLLYFIPVGVHYTNQSDPLGNPTIARPFFDVSGTLPPPSPGEHAVLDSFPGTLVGGVRVDSKLDLYGAEVNGRYHWTLCPGLRADVLLGFRYLHLAESLLIQDHVVALTPIGAGFLGGPVPAGALITDFDSFGTRNNFYGMQTGGSLRWNLDWLFLYTYAKLAIGPITQQAMINGGTTMFANGTAISTPGGVLALPSNIGNYKRVMIGVVPELGFNLGINLTPNLQIFGGYSFLLINTVLRPGNQIDHQVNATQIPTSTTFGAGAGPPAPVFHFAGETWWQHQLNVGLNLHF
jgi:hypothetical protein